MLEQIKAKAADRFIPIYRAVHGVNDTDAKNFLEVEVFNFKRSLEENKSLQDCSELSVTGTFLEVISNGLSFDKSSNHVYLMPRNVNTGTREKPVWEKRLTYSYAANGLVYLAKNAGSIISCTVPTIVYEYDEISVETIDGSQKIRHIAKIPRTSNKILGGFTIVTLPEGNKEQFWFDISEITRLAKYSAKQNKGVANELYSSGQDGQVDEGFLRTKIVKMALKGKPLKKAYTDNEYEEIVTKEELSSNVMKLESGDESYSDDSYEISETF